ncbi:MAG: porin family protein [Alphaproteobacteria bacterium]|nr:porin family protein [Alphaproteobacteria bacterium]
MSNRLKTALAIGGLTTMLMTSQAQAGLDGNPFEGLYLGFNANYSKVTADATYEILDANTNSFGGISSSSNSTGYGGVLYGGIGTNIWGPMYVGIEAGLGVNGGTSFVTDGTSTFGLKAGFSLDITTRVGMTVSDRVLVYALGGYTSIKFSNKGFVNGQSKGLGGYRYGAGFEVGILEDIALRVEYVRTAHAAVTWTQAGDSFRFDPSTQVFRIGVILHMD